MPVKVDVKQFSANSPLDYADLNKLVTAIQTLAASITTVVTPAPGSNTGGTTVKTGPTILSDHVTPVRGKEITKSDNKGIQTRIPFRRNGKNVTFVDKPLVVAMGSHSSGNGVAVVNVIETTTTGFVAQVGWVGKSSGNIGLKYIAVGTEIASADNDSDKNQTGNSSDTSYLDRESRFR